MFPNYLIQLNIKEQFRFISEKFEGIIIPAVEHCMGAEIAEARGTLTCIKEHQSVDIGNVLGHGQMYRAYAEHRAITCTSRVFTT